MNLSESGALLRLKDAAPFDRGVLTWIDHEAFGTVAWRDGEQIGLRFDEPIDRAWLLDTRERLPALAKGTDEFRQFASDWATGGGETPAPRQRATAIRLNRSLPSGRGSSPSSGARSRWVAIADWLRAGWRILLSAALVGIAAGIWSCYY